MTLIKTKRWDKMIRIVLSLLLLCIFRVDLVGQNMISTNVGYKVVVEIPVVNIGTIAAPILVPSVEVYGSGTTVNEITPIAERNINHEGDDTQLIKRIFYVAPNSDIRLGVVSEYRFALGLNGVATTTSTSSVNTATGLYKWSPVPGSNTFPTLTITYPANNTTTFYHGRGFVMTLISPQTTTGTGVKFGGKTIYKDQDIISTLTLKLQLSSTAKARDIMAKGLPTDTLHAGSAVGMSFGNPIKLTTFQDLLALQGLIRMHREGTTNYNDPDKLCYGYVDANSGASQTVTYAKAIQQMRNKGIDYTRWANSTTVPQQTSDFFASQYYSISEGITLPNSYGGIGQPSMNATAITNVPALATPFVGFIECTRNGSVSMKYTDLRSDPVYKAYGFIRLFGNGATLCLARNLNILGAIDIGCSDLTTASGRVVGGLVAYLDGANAFLSNSVCAIASSVETGGDAIFGGLVGYMKGAAAISSYAMYAPDTPPDAFEELFNHRLRLDNIGSQFRINSNAASTAVGGGLGYAVLDVGSGGISRMEVGIENGQIISRAKEHTYIGGVVGLIDATKATTSFRDNRLKSGKGFDMRGSSENNSTTVKSVYAAGLIGHIIGAATNTAYYFELFNNVIADEQGSEIAITARDEKQDGYVDLYASAYYAYITNPTRVRAIFGSSGIHQQAKVSVNIIQNGNKSSLKVVGGIFGYGLPLLIYPSDSAFVFNLSMDNLHLSIQEKVNQITGLARGSSYGGLFCGHPNRAILPADFQSSDFTFSNSTLSLSNEPLSLLSTGAFYVGGLLGQISTASTIQGLRLTLDNTQISAKQSSYSLGVFNIYAGGVVGRSTTASHLLQITLTGRNNSSINADNAADDGAAEPFIGGLLGFCNNTRIVDCIVQGANIIPSSAQYDLGLFSYNRNNGNTPGIGGLVGRSQTGSVSYNPDDPYNSLAVNQRPCLMSRSKVDKVYIYGYGYNKVAGTGNDVMIGGLVGVAQKSSTVGNVGVLCEVSNSLIMGVGEDKVEVLVGGISGTDWNNTGTTGPDYSTWDRCIVRNTHILAKGENQWAAAAGITTRVYTPGGTPRYSNCMVLDSKIEVHTLSHRTIAGGIYGTSDLSTQRVEIESCFSNADMVIVNPNNAYVNVGGLAAGGYVSGSASSITFDADVKHTIHNSFFDPVKAGTPYAFARNTMINSEGHSLDFSNRYLIETSSAPVFNPKTLTNPNSSNLQQSTTGTGGLRPYSSKITYAAGADENNVAMHQSRFNGALVPNPSWELYHKTPRPVGSRLPSELWVSPWNGAPFYKLGEILRVVVPADTVISVHPLKIHLHQGVGIRGQEFVNAGESLETFVNDPTPIQLTSYTELVEDAAVIDPDNYKDERRVIKWLYSRSASTNASGKLLTPILIGELLAKVVETGYHLTINCTDPILKDEIFYVQTTDFKESKFSVPVRIRIAYTPPIDITIQPIYGTRPERGTSANPFIVFPNQTYSLSSIIKPDTVSNSSHFYTLVSTTPASAVPYVTTHGTLFVNATPIGSKLRINVKTVSNKADGQPATDEIWCEVHTPAIVSFVDELSAIKTYEAQMVIDDLLPYQFRVRPVLGYTLHSAHLTPRNVTVTLQYQSGRIETEQTISEGILNPSQTLFFLPNGFDWRSGVFTFDPIVLAQKNSAVALDPIIGISVYFQYYKQVTITFDHNDGQTFYVFALHQGGKLTEIPGLDMDHDPRLHPSIPSLSFKGWLEQRVPTVMFNETYNITQPFNSSIRLYALLQMSFMYSATHDSYARYANAHSALNGVLIPPFLTDGQRSPLSHSYKMYPEDLLLNDYRQLDQVPMAVNGLYFNLYLSDNKPQPNNILFNSGAVVTPLGITNGEFKKVSFQVLGTGTQTFNFSSGTETLYYYTYFLPQSQIIDLNGELIFVFDNNYKVKHETMGTIPSGATERDDIFYHRDEEIKHSSYPRFAQHCYIGWKGKDSRYEVGSLMPEETIVLQGKWAVAQVKNNPSDDFYHPDITRIEHYNHLYHSLQDAIDAAQEDQTVQLMAQVKENVTIGKKIVYDSKFTVPREKINDTENKVIGSVVLTANTNGSTTVNTANVQLYHHLVASVVGIQAHTFGNKAQIDYYSNQIQADTAYLELTLPAGDPAYAWYPIHLPFRARVADVKNKTGKTLIHPEEFGIAQYNGERRADKGIGNIPWSKDNDWLYISPDPVDPNRNLTVISHYIGNDQVMQPFTAYMVNNRRTGEVLRFYTTNQTFSDQDKVSFQEYPCALPDDPDKHKGWNYLSQPMGYNATVDLPAGQIIQVSTDFSSDKTFIGKQEASYVAKMVGVDHIVIAPYTNFFYQSLTDGEINFTKSDDPATVKSGTIRSNGESFLDRYELRLTDSLSYDALFVSSQPGQEAFRYQTGRDVMKMGEMFSNSHRLYSKKNQTDLCAIHAPSIKGKADIPLCFHLPEEKIYHLNVHHSPSDQSQLFLLENGRKVINLTQKKSYPIDAKRSVGITYSLQLQKEEDQESDPAVIYGEKSVIVIENGQTGSLYNVFDPAGILVSQGRISDYRTTIPLLNKGVYIVSLDQNQTKVVVR